MSNLPKATIAIPNLNGAAHIKTCLESLRELNYPQELVETIVFDNGSTDDSVALITRDFPEVKVIKNKENTGFAYASNEAARQGTGQVVAFLNNDMKVDSQWLMELVKALDYDEDIICTASKMLNWQGDAIDFAGSTLNFYGHGFQDGYQSKDLKAFDEPKPLLFACGGAMLVDRKIFLDAGGFDEDYFAFFEDVDLGWRLWLLGYKVMFAPASVTYHHHHGTASSFPFEQVYVLWERNAAYTWYKNYNQDNLDKIMPVALLMAIERSLVYLGADRADYRLIANRQMKEQDLPDDEPSVVERLRNALRDEGLGSTIKKVAKKGRSALAGQPDLPADHTVVAKLGVGTIAAIDQFVENLPKFQKKRDELQKRRKRDDEDIFVLFGDPFKSSCENARYIRQKAEMVKLFGIDKIFERDAK